MKTGMYVGTIVSMLAIVLSPFAVADSNRYVNQFNPVGGETGTLYSGNVASTFAVDSNPIVVNETVVYDAPVIQTFLSPDGDLGDEFWTQSGCYPNSYDCINDNPLTDGDGDTTHLEAPYPATGFDNVNVSTNSIIPIDALITSPEPFLLVRGRVVGSPVGDEDVFVHIHWRYGTYPSGSVFFCDTVSFLFTSETYTNYGISLPDCDATNQPWNVTMLNGLELTFRPPILGYSNTNVRITMAYVRIHHQEVLYSAAVGWSFEFLDVQAQLINRIVWNCTHTGDLPLSLGILTPPSPASRTLVAATMCEGADEDSFSPLYASDIDGDIGSIVVIISGTNTTVSPGFFSLDQIIIVQNGTKTINVLDFGGSLCWLLAIALVFIAMITVIVIKKRNGRNGSMGRNG